MEEPPLTVGDLAQLLGLFSGAAVFLVLIVLDLWNAIKKGSNWVPGHALVLSALTIQALNFVENQGALLDQMLDGSNPKQPLSGDVVTNNLFMMHSSRVMLCVLVAFFLPGIARPGKQEKWTKILALGLSVILDIFSELLSIRRRLRESGLYLATYLIYTWPHATQVNVVVFIVSGAIITLTLIWLVALLVCAALASTSIQNLTAQRTLYILEKPKEDSWKALEDQVLKSWIVSRACHPESIIASSVLGSSAAFGLTACILFSIAGWIFQGPAIKILGGAAFWIKFIITIMEVIFIIIGWAIVGWRWLTATAYYGAYYRIQGQSESQSQSESQGQSQGQSESHKGSCRCGYFEVEDFWTRHIVELLEAEEMKLRKLKVAERISKIFAWKLRNLKVDENDVSILTTPEVKKKISLKGVFLLCMVWFQKLVVFLSKVLSFLTEFTLYNKLTRCVVENILLKKHLKKVNDEFEKDRDIVKNVAVLWQTPKSVFSMNRKSIIQVQEIMEKGHKDGESCHVLITLLNNFKERYPKQQTPHSWDQVSAPPQSEPHTAQTVWDQVSARAHSDLNRLSGMDGEVLPSEEEYLIYGKRSWKLKAVSLIYIIVRLSPQSEKSEKASPQSEKAARRLIQEYYEAWEMMNLVESSDPTTHSLLSRAADSLFNELTNILQNEKSKKQTRSSKEEPKAGEQSPSTMKDLAEDCKKKRDECKKIIDQGRDRPVEWENLVAWNASYKLCMTLVGRSGNIAELMKELDNSFTDIIGGCLCLVGQALVDKCRTWAQDLEKNKLLEALYVAGKYKGLMEGVGVDRVPNLQTAKNGANEKRK